MANSAFRFARLQFGPTKLETVPASV